MSRSRSDDEKILRRVMDHYNLDAPVQNDVAPRLRTAVERHGLFTPDLTHYLKRIMNELCMLYIEYEVMEDDDLSRELRYLSLAHYLKLEKAVMCFFNSNIWIRSKQQTFEQQLQRQKEARSLFDLIVHQFDKLFAKEPQRGTRRITPDRFKSCFKYVLDFLEVYLIEHEMLEHAQLLRHSGSHITLKR